MPQKRVDEESTTVKLWKEEEEIARRKCKRFKAASNELMTNDLMGSFMDRVAPKS